MRIIAAFGIILLHETSNSVLFFSHQMSRSDIYMEGIFQNLLMWCVPVFLMITGALMLDPARELPIKKIYKKYILRMVLALAVFTLIYQLYDFAIAGDHEPILKAWLTDLIFARGWRYLWYIYLLISVYMMLPLFRAATCSPDRLPAYFIPLLGIFTSLIPTLQLFGLGELGLDLPITVVYPLYLLLGYQLYRNKIPVAWAALMTAGSTAAIVGLTVWSISSGKLQGTEFFNGLAGYDSIFTVVQSAGIFALLDHFLDKGIGPFAKSVDKCTFGIYLIHVIGIHYIMGAKGLNPYSWGTSAAFGVFIAMAAGLYAASAALTWLIRRIPGQRLL
ncbi:MAG: acyltransferase family protein [Eubacteriales bacterium]|nr:acyltransferase family protein [Eubacteriales bacterium]